MSAFEIWHASDLKRDQSVLEDRLHLEPQSVHYDDGRVALRWDHADDPWMEYDAEHLNRLPSDEEDPAWQRDRPFWAVLDQSEVLDDDALLAAWEDALFAFHMVKDRFRWERLGMEPTEVDAALLAEFRASWDAEREAGRQARRDGTWCVESGYHRADALHDHDECPY